MKKQRNNNILEEYKLSTEASLLFVERVELQELEDTDEDIPAVVHILGAGKYLFAFLQFFFFWIFF